MSFNCYFQIFTNEGTACVLKRKSAKSQRESKGDILDQHPDQLHNAMAARNKVTDHSKVADNDLESSQSNQQVKI